MVQPYLELSFCEAVKNTQTPQDIWYWEHCVPEGQKAYSMTKPIRLEHHPLRPCPKSGRAKRPTLVDRDGLWRRQDNDLQPARGSHQPPTDGTDANIVDYRIS